MDLTALTELDAISLFLLCVGVLSAVWIVAFTQLPSRSVREALRLLGIARKRIARTLKEINRKTFHLCGSIIPIVYFVGLTHTTWMTQELATIVLGGFVAFVWTIEISRMYIPPFSRMFFAVFGRWMRETEKTKITGVAYYQLGAFLCIAFFPPHIAVASILFLVLGDLTAALIGISFGRIKIGKKSLEGTLAMFSVCFGTGMVMFHTTLLSEYSVFVGAATAALVELLEPFGIDDNLAIPVSSALALTFANFRLRTEMAEGLST